MCFAFVVILFFCVVNYVKYLIIIMPIPDFFCFFAL